MDKAITLKNKSDPTYQDVYTGVVTQVSGIPDCATVNFMKPNCLTLLWAPNTSAAATAIASAIASTNVPAIPASKMRSFASATEANLWVQTVNSGSDNNFALALGVVEFFVTGAESPPASITSIDFGLQVNATTKNTRGVVEDDMNLVLLPFQAAVEREIGAFLARAKGLQPPAWSVSVATFPRPAADTFSLVGAIAPTFLLAAAMFTFTIQIYNVVLERELKLRSSMRVMGVSDLVWWISWVLWDVFVNNLFQALTICAFGCAFPFDLFRRNQFSVVFIHFWLFEVSLTGLAYFCSVFVGKSNGSTVFGFVIYLFGFIFQLIVGVAGLPFGTDYGGPQWGSLSGNGQYYWLQVLFSFFPPTLFAKGIRDLGIATSTSQLPGIKWRTRDSYCYCNPLLISATNGAPPYGNAGAPPAPPTYSFFYGPPTWYFYGGGSVQVESTHQCSATDYQVYRAMFPSNDCDYSIAYCWSWFIIDFFVFFTLAVFYDGWFADENGVRQNRLSRAFHHLRAPAALSPLVWLLDGVAFTWGLVLTVAVTPLNLNRFFKDSEATLEYAEAAAQATGSQLPDGLEEDVAAEEMEIKARLMGSGQGLRGPLQPNVAVEVRGLTKSFPLGGGNTFHAVRGNYFRVETGKLFALLGPNGAGKTTTINLLTGALPISSGDASVAGLSLAAGQLPAIRRLMGVCPQFDILWGELTAREHLRLFAALKGLPRHLWDATTTELLDRTKLTPAADRRSSSFSGGMKRRLSVGIALIGDPEIIYLDEPTTGMDPITRRYVWDIILEAKAGRAIVLTTHSMEEADVLADTITIIAKGRLRCFGSPLRLKNKFGSGYRISVSATPTLSSSGSSTQLDSLTRSGSSAALAALSARNAPLHAFFKSSLGLEVGEEAGAYSTFVIPRSLDGQVGPFLKELLGRREKLGLTDVQMSQTTLEQVFLLIAREAEKQSAKAEGKSVVLEVDVGGRTEKLVVHWGAEQVLVGDPSQPEVPPEPLDIHWIQDDEGRLMYAYHTWRGVRVVQPHVNDALKKGSCCPCC